MTSRQKSLNQPNRFPPSYHSQPIMTRKIRYKASAALTGNVVTRGCIECFMVTRSATASTTEALTPIESCRIAKIEMWGVDNTTPTAMTTISLLWAGDNSPNREVSATGNSEWPAHIVSRPPKNSSAGWWNSEGSDDQEPLFYVVGPAGTVIDATFEYVFHDGVNGDSVTLTSATTNVGVFYPHLDSLSASNTAGTQLLVPQSLTTIALASQ